MKIVTYPATVGMIMFMPHNSSAAEVIISSVLNEENM